MSQCHDITHCCTQEACRWVAQRGGCRSAKGIEQVGNSPYVKIGQISTNLRSKIWKLQKKIIPLCPNMTHLPEIIKKTLSARISLMVVGAMTVLLMASTAVIFYYSRKAVKNEAVQKATLSLESAVQNIDNILLSVEQATGNTYFSMMTHLNSPDEVLTYSRKLVENNPYIGGCTIAFKENFYKDRRLYMAYIHRNDSAGVAYAGTQAVEDDNFGNNPYTAQRWYTEAMENGKPIWLNPLADENVSGEEPIITFSLPIPGTDGKPIGVIAADVSLSLLSKIAKQAKPSPHSYCTLLDKDGEFIVHPTAQQPTQQSALDMSGDASFKEAINMMITGETGYKSFKVNGTDYLVFYKPFERTAVPGRSVEALKWSFGIIFPEDDIFGDYNNILYYVLAIVLLGLLLTFVLSSALIHWQLTPLRMLTEQAEHIARVNYEEPVPDSGREDEVGRLQDNFSHMQKSLVANIWELEQLTDTLHERSVGLRKAYNQAKKADRLKTAFLHNMTNQMLAPAEAIERDVNTLCDFSQKIDKATASQLTEDIQRRGNNIAELLKNLINISDEDLGKEVAHD